MKNMREEMDIVAAHQLVGTYRGAAELCGVTHKTVKRVVERIEAGSERPVRAPRPANYEDVRALVSQAVTAGHGRASAKRLLPRARIAGYAGSDRNFRRLVAEEKARYRRANGRGRRPAVWSPGEHLVIDWGVIAGVHVFCAVLAWSRVRFVRFAADEKQATTLAMLAECFEALGGVPKVVLADRMGCLKGGVVANRVVPTSDYVRFAMHYRYRPDFCEGHDPESKGIVENLVGYGKEDLLGPLLVELALTGGDAGEGEGEGEDGQDLAAARVLGDLPAANERAVAWCAEVNAAVHSEICAVPAERLIAEREVLTPVPSLRPSIGPAPVTRKVDKLSTVRLGSARYSVPTRLRGSQVAVVMDGPRVIILDAATGEVYAQHPLTAPGEASILDEHYGGPRAAAPARAIRPRTVAEKDFCALGPVAEAFIAGAAGAGHTRLGPELAELNTLAAAHGTEAMLAAL
ncbi:MAG TPA: IS21 family transposase, partial [Dermatophilaceae bacterium]|nr:IS21 family transposase [Dermatophilaceae bacterium]